MKVMDTAQIDVKGRSFTTLFLSGEVPLGWKRVEAGGLMLKPVYASHAKENQLTVEGLHDLKGATIRFL